MLYPLSYEGWGVTRYRVTVRCRSAERHGRPPDRSGRYDARVATVLVVEDDPVILQLLEVNFELEGFSVVTAKDGFEGLTQAKEGRPDVIVTDIMMPRRSGLEMLADLKADGALAEIPVILLSAKAQTADVRAGLEAGAADYITKPFEPLDLLERVQRVLAS
jgi:DNA-binding response OmpR family regulator